MTHYIAMFFVVVPFFWKRNGKHPDRRSKHLLNPSYCFSQFTATFCYVWFGLNNRLSWQTAGNCKIHFITPIRYGSLSWKDSCHLHSRAPAPSNRFCVHYFHEIITTFSTSEQFRMFQELFTMPLICAFCC